MTGIGDAASGLFRIIGGLKGIMPIAKALGGDLIGKVVDTVTTVTEIATNVKDRVEQGEIIVRTGDKDELDDIIRELTQINDDLAEYIAKS